MTPVVLPSYPGLRVIPGLERLYHGRQPWLSEAQQEEYEKLHPDQNNQGYLRGFVFNGAFEGSMELQAAEALYDAVLSHACEAAKTQRPIAVAETGTCDGLSTAFIAKALSEVTRGVVRDLAKVGVVFTDPTHAGHVWTCEWADLRSTGVPRPWPRLWEELELDLHVTACVGDSRLEEPWRTGGKRAKDWRGKEVVHGVDGSTDTMTVHYAQPVDRPLPDLLDVLFLDSDHTEAQVLAEWAVLGPRLRPGGLVLLHDVLLPGLQGAEVQAAMSRIANELGADPEFLNSCRGLALIRKPA